MRPWIVPALALAVLPALAAPAQAEEMVATRPGVMCRSAEALGRLTLPDGGSRSALPRPRPEDLRLKAAGGCIDIPPHARVTVLQAYHNTSSVLFDPGEGGAQAFTVPNIDFAALPGAPGAVGSANAAMGGAGTVPLGSSTELGVSVLAENPDWCTRTPRLRVQAQDPSVLGSPALDRLLQRFGAAVLARRCPAATGVQFAGATPSGPAAWQATASAGEGWAVRPQVAAPAASLDLDQLGGASASGRGMAMAPPPVGPPGHPVPGAPAFPAPDPATAPVFPAATASPGPASATDTYAMGPCPASYPEEAGHRLPLVCTCDPASLATGDVFGTDLYSYASVPCRAALHAGVLAQAGGTAAFFPVPGQRPRPGSDRNGVDSGSDDRATEAFSVRHPTPAVMAYVRDLTLRDRDPAMDVAVRASDGRMMVAQPTPPAELPDYVTASPIPGATIALPNADAVSLPIAPPPLAGRLPAVPWLPARVGPAN